MAAAASLDRTWSRNYVAFMRCQAGDLWMSEVESQLASWLHEKGLDVDVRGDVDLDDGERQASLRRLDSGRNHDLRFSMVEQTRVGTWTTELIAHDEPGFEDWIYLSVSNELGRFVDVPRIARYLMQVLPLGDGTIEFVDRPRTCRIEDVDQLIEALTAPQRHGLIFVAGTDHDERLPAGAIDAFTKKVGQWSRQVYGLAQVVVLDPASTRELSRRVGPRFAAPAWTIRTYHPGVDLGSGLDARRHRILGTSSLAERPDRSIAELLGDIARNQVLVRDLPVEVQRLRRRFDRNENRRLLQGLVADGDVQLRSEAPVLEPAPAADSPVDQPTSVAADSRVEPAVEQHRLLALVQTILKIEITDVSLRDIASRLHRDARERDRVVVIERRVEELQSRSELLEDENRALADALKDGQLELEIAHIDVDDRDDRIRWLESRLKAAGDYESTYLEVPPEFQVGLPDNFEDLLIRIREIPGVEFTGDADTVVKLNQVDTNEAALRTAWEAVRALGDYVRARACGDCDQSLDHYLNQTPPGYVTFPPGKFAATETGTTMKAFGKERIFPVPAAIRPSERVEMPAHFKLARIGMVTPRMHLYDAHPQHPTVYIGYIGPHLTNTQT